MLEFESHFETQVRSGYVHKCTTKLIDNAALNYSNFKLASKNLNCF